MIDKNRLIRIPQKINHKGDIEVMIGVINPDTTYNAFTNHAPGFINIQLLGKHKGFTASIHKNDIQYCEGQ